MATETLIIVVGGDYLAYEICREILKTAGQRIALIWRHEDERAQRLLDDVASALGAEFPDTFAFFNEDATDARVLRMAGLRAANEAPDRCSYCVVAVSQDDRMNLRVALLARDINDRVRVTIRQFNPLLGHKIQEGLKYNCTAISPAAHAAATYAAAAVDPSCFYALPFPTLEAPVAKAIHRSELNGDRVAQRIESGGLFGFCERTAGDFGIGGMNVVEAEAHLRARVVAINDAAPYCVHGDEDHADAAAIDAVIDEGDRVVAFGPIAHLKEIGPWRERQTRSSQWKERWSGHLHDFATSVRRTEPILRSVFLGALVLYALFVVFFIWNLHLNVIASMYYVMSTMTTVGYGDITACGNCATKTMSVGQIAGILTAMLVMLVGITIFAVFTATVTSGLNAATTRRLRGLRRIHRSGHIIVCGAGNVGSLVVEYLRELDEHVVVVEQNPDAILMELARDRKIDLLTGDATNDETIGYCSPERAKALVGVTNSDTANLEVALGARTRTKERGNGDIHVVLRIDDLAFGVSIKRHFDIASFSTTELTAPTIAGLARFESTRGRFDIFAGTPFARTFQLAERFQGAENTPPPAPPERPGYKVRWVPLYVWREQPGSGKGVAVPVHKFRGDVRPGDRLLFMVPLDQFSE
ncbi:MAG TPA: NAD-binding protein [Candidatus Baltobacteraceae bacterium]|nr:NAD-binding protein [Candidatus Baltobacteraceae bacterium]